jgi:pimeloyl-ACP methyl ester carboxylesterase
MQREPAMHYRSVETGGATIQLAESGAGKPAFVFLHYWGGSARTWLAVIHRLVTKGRCTALDQRGWGESVAKDGRYDLGAMADDVEAVVRCLDLRRFVLVGHSMGGKVAQIVAKRRPKSLEGLVLVAPAPPTPMEVPQQQRDAMLASYGSREGVMEALSVLAGSPLSDLIREQVIEDTLRGSQQAKCAWTQHNMMADVSKGLDAVTIPVSVVVGDRDQVEVQETLRTVIARFIPMRVFECFAALDTYLRLRLPMESQTLVSNCLDASSPKPRNIEPITSRAEPRTTSPSSINTQSYLN